MLERLSEEAAAFEQAAPNLIAEETLVQRSIKPAHRRFRPRIISEQQQLTPEWQTREIVSEYTYGAAPGDPGNIREFRRVLSVDGRPVEESRKAVEALAKSIRSDDDQARLRLLQAFAKHGLVGTITDIGQIILLFERRNLQRFEFQPAGSTMIGAERCLIFRYEQLEGPEQVTVWQGSRLMRAKLAGQIFVRQSDYLPIRITFASVVGEGQKAIREEAQVEYAQSRYGSLAPVSVVHREYRNGALTTENLFSYSSFRKFGSSSGVRFQLQAPGGADK
jgi:hypothetical protein